MTDRNSFNKSIQSIAADGKEETSKFIARLKTLTPEEFLRLPRHDLERLTMAQYAEVAAAICPGLDLRLRHEPEPEPALESKDRSWSLCRHSMASVAASLVVAISVALLGPIVGSIDDEAVLARPRYAGDWPRCARLTEIVDGCVYVPRQHLDWDYVAYMLGMTVTGLQDLNLHLPSTHAPAGEKIIVWRGIGRLEN